MLRHPNKVDPDTQSAATLIAAVLANQPLAVTGGASGGDGVEIVEPTTPVDTPVTASPAATPDPTATADARFDLPTNVPGTNADQITCTVGLG